MWRGSVVITLRYMTCKLLIEMNEIHMFAILKNFEVQFFLALQTCLTTFQTKNNIRRASASSALALILHQSHNTCTANRHQRDSGVTQRRTIVSFDRTMMQALELLQLVKRHVSR